MGNEPNPTQQHEQGSINAAESKAENSGKSQGIMEMPDDTGNAGGTPAL